MEGLGVQGIMRNVCNVLVGKPERRDHLECLGLDGRILLKC
jgi:hypothetical protein